MQKSRLELWNYGWCQTALLGEQGVQPLKTSTKPLQNHNLCPLCFVLSVFSSIGSNITNRKPCLLMESIIQPETAALEWGPTKQQQPQKSIWGMLQSPVPVSWRCKGSLGAACCSFCLSKVQQRAVKLIQWKPSRSSGQSPKQKVQFSFSPASTTFLWLDSWTPE